MGPTEFLLHALENLFRNAVDHGSASVTVSVGCLDSNTGFYVADDGPGIPHEECEKILEYGDTTADEGTGIGLSIVRTVADAHGWDLAITESTDGGACFEFEGRRPGSTMRPHTSVREEHERLIARGLIISHYNMAEQSEFPDYLDVEYNGGEGEDPADYPTIEDKVEKAIEVTRKGLEEYENPVVMWTGGKDSTLTLYFIKEVAEQFDLEVPPAVFIDHYQHFDEIHDFVDHWADEWALDVIYAQNEDVGDYVEANDLDPGDDIPVDALDDHNQHHVRNILEYEEDSFPFLLDTYVGNHLLKTVALNQALEEQGVDGVISGVRWDEQEARADETFFSPRHDPDTYPPHDRVQPILQFDEPAVWETFWQIVVPETVEGYPDDGYVPESAEDLPNDLTQGDIPVSPKYFAGFRSLGSEVSTEKSDEEPAWLQDMANTTERAGRAQDKEDLMERLRDLGYM